MYNEMDTVIAKARYTTSLPTLISYFYYWSVLTGLVFGEGVYPFLHQVARIFFLKKLFEHGEGGKREKGHLSCQQ